ncbi:MAG: STAS domain-containing protein [Planctomycetes bacterium]|nr:STAS domain-containing protein [Planctomycetota bacterium]
MARTSALATQRTPLPDGMVVSISGEIDFSRSPALRSELIAVLGDKPARLVIDLAGVPYMDSSGVATLVETLRTQRDAARKLVICGMQPKVRGIFEIARLNTVFIIVGDLEAARQA